MKIARSYWLATLAAALSVFDALRSLLLICLDYVDEDVAIYWYAAQEFAHLIFREPFFYGQSYHHLGEALLAVPLVLIGVPVWIATSVVSMTIGIAPWFLLAFLAHRRGADGLSIVLLATPALMPAGYQILLSRYFGMGIFLVILAFYIADVSKRQRLWLTGFLIALGGLVVPNAVLPVVAGLPWLVCSRVRNARNWLSLGLGIAVATALYASGRFFYVLHPGWALHPAPFLAFNMSLLDDALRHLPRHLTRVTPTTFIHPAVLLVGLTVLACWSAFKQEWSALASSFAVVATVILALGLSKVHEGTASVFFAYERMFLGLPVSVALVALTCHNTSVWPTVPSRRAVVAAIFVTCAIAISKQITLARDVDLERRTPGSVCEQTSVSALRDLSYRVEQATQSAGTDLAVFLVYRTFAYACGALCYGKVTTLYPPYERRTWLLEDEARKHRERVLLVDVEPDLACRQVSSRVPDARCAILGPTMVGVSYGPASALSLVRRLGIFVRKF